MRVLPPSRVSSRPEPQGLYDGDHEHDACGVAFVAKLDGMASHDVVVKALTALRNLDHRGAVGVGLGKDVEAFGVALLVHRREDATADAIVVQSRRA